MVIEFFGVIPNFSLFSQIMKIYQEKKTISTFSLSAMKFHENKHNPALFCGLSHHKSKNIQTPMKKRT